MNSVPSRLLQLYSNSVWDSYVTLYTFTSGAYFRWDMCILQHFLNVFFLSFFLSFSLPFFLSFLSFVPSFFLSFSLSLFLCLFVSFFFLWRKKYIKRTRAQSKVLSLDAINFVGKKRKINCQLQPRRGKCLVTHKYHGEQGSSITPWFQLNFQNRPCNCLP